jgi:hypothetical protein
VKRFQWIDRVALSRLLTEQLRAVAGCEGATIEIGATQELRPNHCNWEEYRCVPTEDHDPDFVRAVAGGVVSEAREHYNVLDS